MPTLITATPDNVHATCDVLVIGAGAAGLIAALRAHAAGAHVIVVERDAMPRGSTALSAGLIPAAGTKFQAAAGIQDSPDQFAMDILRKADQQPDPRQVATATSTVGPALEWLSEAYGLPISVIGNFNYPGHSAFRMHGLPSRSGGELMDRLRTAVEATDITLVTNATAAALYADAAGHIGAAQIVRPDGTSDTIGCRALILACNGYGGNPERVARHIPELATALYFGHTGNQGDALAWGEALGAASADLSGHQGHGSVAHPHGILITWATMTEGGFQVNAHGERFSDESHGYSEQAANVLRQPGGIAWSVFDQRIAEIAGQFEDFKTATANGAVMTAATVPGLAAMTGLPEAVLAATFADVERHKQSGATDGFGRPWASVVQLQAPFCAVKVTGALFHTQGGLMVDQTGRVLRTDGTPLPNVFAAGGAARGVSGSKASGYLSGNGLLTAVAYGYLAGDAAAQLAKQRSTG
jgi:fumarate reductase flavoprotein subunit